MRKYTLSEEVRMWEEVLGITRNKKSEPCPFCSVPVDESDASDSEETTDPEDK
jgi:hypothetical protein